MGKFEEEERGSFSNDFPACLGGKGKEENKVFVRRSNVQMIRPRSKLDTFDMGENQREETKRTTIKFIVTTAEISWDE